MSSRAIVCELAAAVVAVLFVATPAMSQPLAPGPRADAPYPAGDLLPPSAIVASVRSAGFNPLSRPVQRGPVYVVFAADRYFMDVRVLVDARSGRVLSATRLAGVLYGGPGYGSYEVVPGAPPGYLPPYERPRGAERLPVPPADIPGQGEAAQTPAEVQPVDVAKRSPPRRPPLPRARPEGAEAAARPPESQPEPPPTAAVPQAPPTAAVPREPPNAAVPQTAPPVVQTDVVPKPAQAAPAMVPVAPLESAPKSPPSSTMVPIAPLE